MVYRPLYGLCQYHCFQHSRACCGQRRSGSDRLRRFLCLLDPRKEIRPGKAKAYLGSIARNKAKESTRKTGRELPLEDDMLVISSGTPERELEKREQAAYIRKAVLALREPEREIFLRYYYFYQPVSTIAEEMGLESANVKTKLFRGRKKLKEVLEKGGYFVEA
ncbi:MAG: RNA polymerase sigma factor [Oscillospiraceae bacterium]